MERAIDSAVQQIRETEVGCVGVLSRAAALIMPSCLVQSDPIAVGVGTEERVDLLCLVPENTGDEELEKVSQREPMLVAPLWLHALMLVLWCL